MNKNFWYSGCAALLLLFAAASASAEDIDIYSQNTNVPIGAPNVLIVLDNTANWSQSFAGSTKFAAEMTALFTVVNALKSQFNLGLMMFTETGSPNNNTDGGYVRFAIQPMTDSGGNPTDARNCLLKMVGGNTSCTSSNLNYSQLLIGSNPGDKSNGGKAGVTMGEAYDYFAGASAYAGNNKVKADPLAFLSNSILGPTYKKPAADGCQKNFIIVINNGSFQDNASDTATAASQLGAVSGDTTVISPPDNNPSGSNEADEWVRYLRKASSINAITYTLEVGPSTTGQGPYNTALLQSMGRQGEGGYYSAIDSTTLLAALGRIFSDIQATNSVFASSSLPLSSDNSGSFLNQVYMGVFRPDTMGRPRWVGNLKEYQFKVDANKNLYLADSAGLPAAGSTGFATPEAVSYWTSIDTTLPPDAPNTASPAGTGGFWFFDAKGKGLTYDSPDGDWVEKGAAAQRLRNTFLGYSGIKGINDSTSPRMLYTCTTGCPSSSATPPLFNTANTDITDSVLGTSIVSVSSITNSAAKSVTSLSAGTPISIAAISKSGGLGLATTAAAHNFLVGDQVVIAGTANGLDGSYAVVTAPTATTFTFSASNGNGSATSGTVTKTSTIASATAPAHGFSVNERITIAGATPTAFNGVATVISVADADHFNYTLKVAQGQAATGTITARSNTVTATATAHGFVTGDAATIAGATPSPPYSGVFIVTVIDANTFTYSTTAAAPTSNASGTITAAVGGGHDTLINWVRGLDTQDENGANGTTDVRASIHGDVLHSRPVVLDYGGSTGSYIFYGGNDGVFRAIKGGKAATDGLEQWGFVAPELFGQLKRQYNNSPQVLYSSTPGGIVPTPVARDYFFDGTVGTYVTRNSTGGVTKAILYVTMRRGGRFIYAIDVTNPTAPKILWRKKSSDAGFAELGRTWSQPIVAKVTANANPVLIFGAGYDPASEDAEPPTAAGDTIGRGIFVLDALTGAPIWAASGDATNFTSPTWGSGNFTLATGMNYSIAADVLVVDRSLDGFADRVYAVDVGGGVWRIDIGAADVATWTVSKIAALGDRSRGATIVSGATRKFLFGADVVFGDAFDSLLIGSGDREHPLATHQAQNVVNRFYMVKDATALTGSALGVFDACAATVTTGPSGCTNLFDVTNNAAVPADAKGWFVSLATGEKVVNGPLVTAGHVIFGTNQPDLSNTSCSPGLGIARRYDVNYLTGLASGTFKDGEGNIVRSELAVGGGFLPSPVSGVVEIDGEKYIFTTDNPLNPGGVIPIAINVPQKRFRTYWKELLD